MANNELSTFRYGLNCIVTSIKSNKEVNLRFVIERKQYTVTYIERKKRFVERSLALLLKASEAVKASIWNVPFGPPGTDKRSWYVTDIWTPNVVGMEKMRIPEPTISIVCKIAYNLGREFVVCDLGTYFARDVFVLPRTVIQSAPSVGNLKPDIGDYLLIFALVIWETHGDEQKARLIPLWAHWDANNRTQNCIVHLNIVESGPENSSLIIPDQIPCMWGVIQNVFKKSLKIYVPTICLSVSVPTNAIYQYDESSTPAEGDWLQMWLTPKVKAQMYNHISEVNNWVCSNCCWFGARYKKVYETYLLLRLKTGFFKHGTLGSDAGSKSNTSAITKPKTNSKVPVISDGGDSQLECIAVGTGKVKAIKEKSGILLVNRSEHVFHLALMTVYGIKMGSIKNVKIKDLVDVGSDLRYRLNTKSDGLKAVWIGPEFVTFRHLHFMPQFTEWIRKRNLDSAIVKEMMKEITDNYEAVNKNKEKESNASNQSVLPKKDAGSSKERKSKEGEQLSTSSKHSSQASLGSEEASQLMNEIVSSYSNVNADSVDMDHSYCPEDIASSSTYTKEEEDELEKLWWSEDSEESEDELRPIIKAEIKSHDNDETEGLPDSNSVITADLSRETGYVPSVSEMENPFKKQLMEKNLSEEELYSPTVMVGSSTSLSQPTAEGCTKAVEASNICKIDSKIHTVHDEAATCEKVERLPIRHREDAKSVPTLLIMMELTKFMLEKGKAKSNSEAGKLSAEFIAQLEFATNKSTNDSSPVTYSSVTTQTEITGPVFPLNYDTTEHLSDICKETISSNSLNLVD